MALPRLNALLLLTLWANAEAAGKTTLLFGGDILLGRQVAREIAATGRSPWQGIQAGFDGSDWLMANLEGALGDAADCRDKPADRCFATPEGVVAELGQAGFTALGLANNHSSDLGPDGFTTTRRRLAAAGITPLAFDDSPRFFELNGLQLAIVALSLIPDPVAPHQRIPDPELARKLRLARRLADLVVVSVHWGYELQDWPADAQRKQARWLISQGTDLIVGHHPHVVQAPECIDGKPVFFSLGNLLFDQKYPATKRGLLAQCEVAGGGFSCTGMPTRTPLGSSFPTLDKAVETETPLLAGCRVPLRSGLTIDGQRITPRHDGDRLRLSRGKQAGNTPDWQTPPLPLLDLDIVRLPGEAQPLLFTLERRYSTIDSERGVRPYVYAITPKGLEARWRGSALSRPLLDAVMLPGDATPLCALHRGDSFLVPDPATGATRTMTYQWTGFGFRGIDAAEVEAACADYYRPLVADHR